MWLIKCHAPENTCHILKPCLNEILSATHESIHFDSPLAVF